MKRIEGLVRPSCLSLFTLLVLAGIPPGIAAQTGTVTGTVTRSDGTALGGVRVTVDGANVAGVTDPGGGYTLARVPVGPQVLLFRWLGYQPQQATVTVGAGQTHTVDVTLTARTINLAEVQVTAASRTPEPIVSAPAAVSVISPVTLRNQSLTGQAPTALQQVPGVDLVQSGVNDFNVSARGFNSSVTRRVLVLQDGRDVSVATLGAQEWNALALPLEDVSRMEMVRGPGSALYGANAFAGVIDIRTPPARDVVGTKITLGGGELSTVRGDLRHAGVTSDGQFGYRMNVGYYRSGTDTRPRTAFDGSDASSEYADAVENPVTTGNTSSCFGLSDCLFVERVPLNGQTVDPTTGRASGDPDDLQNLYGSARFDYYANNGSILTAEAGGSQVQNGMLVTGIGRVQVIKATRPYARLHYGSDRFNLSGWWMQRKSNEPQVSLGSGLPIDENSSVFHFEGQVNQDFAEGRGRVIAGASYRNTKMNTNGTLITAARDDRNDNYYSAYTQVEFRPDPKLRFVAASRFDDGALFDGQFSPKGAVVFSPTEDHAVRVSVNRAFQTPNYPEFFVNLPGGAPSASPATLEGGIEQFYAAITNPAVVGPTLAGAMAGLGLQADQPWNFAAQTPTLALGNEALDVETVVGWELGYKGTFNDRAFVSVDFYYNKLKNFVTDLLPGVNQAQYPQYSLTQDGVDAAADLTAVDAALALAGLPANHNLRVTAATLLAGYQQLAASPIGSPALSTVNGTRTVVFSYANTGEVDELGVEFGLGYGITPELRVDGTYTFFDFDIVSQGFQAAGGDLQPNTPKHKGVIALTYTGESGLDFGVTGRFTDAFDWSAGFFSGRVRSMQLVDANFGYRVNNNLRLFVMGSNVFDQQRFQLYGGSVVGRRVMGGLTATY